MALQNAFVCSECELWIGSSPSVLGEGDRPQDGGGVVENARHFWPLPTKAWFAQRAQSSQRSAMRAPFVAL